MANRHTDFWLALLELGDNTEDRRQNWNTYLSRKMPKSFKLSVQHMLREMGEEDLVSRIFGLPNPDGNKLAEFERLAEEHGGHPALPADPNFTGTPAMDFSGLQFGRDVSFAGRLLLFSDFDNASFGDNADFRNTVFGGTASFRKTAFRGTKPGIENGSRFDRAIFGNTVWFTGATFTRTAHFSKAKFRSGAYFDGAEFQHSTGGALFGRTDFKSEASFENAHFMVGASFDHATFRDRAVFQEATFDQHAGFNNAKFMAETSFRKALFRTPPRFFEAVLYEDTDFGDVNWDSAEASYSRSWWKTLFACGLNNHDKDPAGNSDDAARAWDRLALIMNQFEKPHERHTFYRLRMRAQRQPGKTDLLSMVNWLFDVTCDYGWGLRRAFGLWAGHMALGAIVLTCGALGAPCPDEHSCGPAWGKSLLVSFANAHAILGLGSQHGYLDGVHACLEEAVRPEWIMPTVGTIQAVVGPILLFLLLLTARNRFRLG